MTIPPPALKALKSLVGPQNIFTDEASLWLHAYDCSSSRMRPDTVIHVANSAQVAPIIKILNQFSIPFVARAAATNHAGSCSTPQGGVVLNLAGLTRIIQINTQEAFALVEPGVITGQLQEQVAALGFFYAPDPASQAVCTIGGNAAQNASGARCLKYGGTLDHLLEVTCVLPTGQTVQLSRKDYGPDWPGLLTGSEGTLGIITQLKVKILPKASHIKTFLATFPSLEDCVQTVTDLAGRGIIPRCVEAMDQLTAQTIEQATHAGLPTEAAALLILELDGTPKQIAQEEKILEACCRQNKVRLFQAATDEQQRQKLWSGRQSAYAAMARLAPNVLVCDGTVPRSELPATLQHVRKILKENQITASLLFHAGDGNFHPQIIFDERQYAQTQRVTRAVKQILQACVDAGGTISGEHGIGVEKRSVMAYQYDAATLSLFAHIKKALDPLHLANPGKIIPINYLQKARTPQTLRPEVEQLAHQLRQYALQKKPYHIQGSGTWCKPAGTVVSTQTLQHIIDIDLANYTATVQAGISIKTLLAQLKQRGVFCALPETIGTLGGVFSSGCFPAFYTQVTGIQALLPDASCIHYGGKLTKNAAGYNLVRLFAGAQGSLGLVTQLTFKIYAQPQPPLSPRPFRPLERNVLWQQLKQELDPQQLLQVTQEVPA